MRYVTLHVAAGNPLAMCVATKSVPSFIYLSGAEVSVL